MTVLTGGMFNKISFVNTGNRRDANMKKHIAIALFMCMLLCSCQLISQGTGEAVDKNNTLMEDSSETQTSSQGQNPQHAPGIEEPIPENVEIFDDASVEDLVELGNEFLDAAFGGDTEAMMALCDMNLADKIKENPGQYLGTKPQYNISSVDTIIRPGEEKGNYQLQTVVHAIKKDDDVGIKYRYSYLFNVDKVKGDYYITDFKKGKLQDGL